MNIAISSPTSFPDPRYALIVPAAPEHLRELSATMRASDRAEAKITGMSAKAALWRSWRMSSIRRAALVEGGKVAAVWGMAGSPLGDTGYPWLITSPLVEKLPVTFLRQARREVSAMLSIHRRLESAVAANYVKAIGFLELLGFDIGDPVNGFCRVTMEI